MVEEVAFELALKDGCVAKGGKALSQRMQLIRDKKKKREIMKFVIPDVILFGWSVEFTEVQNGRNTGKGARGSFCRSGKANSVAARWSLHQF